MYQSRRSQHKTTAFSTSHNPTYDSQHTQNSVTPSVLPQLLLSIPYDPSYPSVLSYLSYHFYPSFHPLISDLPPQQLP